MALGKTEHHSLLVEGIVAGSAVEVICAVVGIGSLVVAFGVVVGISDSAVGISPCGIAERLGSYSLLEGIAGSGIAAELEARVAEIVVREGIVRIFGACSGYERLLALRGSRILAAAILALAEPQVALIAQGSPRPQSPTARSSVKNLLASPTLPFESDCTPRL